jgi:hypothetical protein
VPDHHCEAAVDHDFTKVVWMAHVAVHAVSDQSALYAQGEILLGVCGGHDGAAHDAQADAHAVPGEIGQWIIGL